MHSGQLRLQTVVEALLLHLEGVSGAEHGGMRLELLLGGLVLGAFERCLDLLAQLAHLRLRERSGAWAALHLAQLLLCREQLPIDLENARLGVRTLLRKRRAEPHAPDF